MSVWDAMDRLAQECHNYLDDLVAGRIQNGDPEALRAFHRRIAPQLGPVSLLSLIRAWQEKYPRLDSLSAPPSKKEGEG